MAVTDTSKLVGMDKLKAMVGNQGRFIYMEGDTVKDFPLSLLVEQIGSGMSLDALGKPDSLSMFGQVQSIADLRLLKPTKDGARVSVRGWNAGSTLGGGEFIGHLNKTWSDGRKDDGGVIFTSSKDWYWERVVNDVQDLNITHFGAVQGTTADKDCAAAFLAMFNWSQTQGGYLPVRFPAGNFYLSKFEKTSEFARLRVCGTGNAYYGYFGTTTLYSNTDAKDGDILFSVNTRWVEFSNLIFDGRSTDKAPNLKGFYKNIIAGGQYFRASCIRWTQVGGNVIDILDALDTKIDQWYASKCTGDVIKGYWSGRTAGNWDHMTAVELTNFNVQSCTKGKVLNLPRCTQSFIYNGWIEHCDNPGDLSNGGWIIDGLQIEDCKGSPLKLTYARIVTRVLGLQSGSTISYEVQDGDQEWLSEYERGKVDINPQGVFIDSVLEASVVSSRYRMSNNTAVAKWFCVGKFFTPKKGDSWEVNLVGCGNNLSVSQGMDDIDSVRQGGGNTLIRLQAKDGSHQATLMPTGSSPLAAARVFANGGNYFTLFVQLKPYTYNIVPLITATGLTRMEAGVSLFWRADCTEVKNLDDGTDYFTTLVTDASKQKLSDIQEQWSIGSKAGVGASGDGELILKGKTEKGYLRVKINGKQCWLKIETTQPA